MVSFKHETPGGVKFTFREPGSEDARQLMSFFNSVVSEPMSGLMLTKKVSLKGEREWLSGRLSEIKSRTTVILLVVQDGRVMGSCHMTRMPGKHSHRAAIGIALRKEIRGMGVGEVLMKKTMELGTRRFKGLEVVDLSSFAYNKRAQNLYKRLGFREYGRVPRSAREGEAYFDEILMRLDLRSQHRG